MAFETYLAAGLTGVAFDRHEGAYVFAREEDAP
jgi:hypothetical protein